MKNLGYLFLLLLSSCSAVKQLERAQRLVAEHQQVVPADTVFKYLLAANPKLKERTTRTVTKVVHDTVRVVKTVYLPPAAPKAHNPLVDSLIRAASKQLRIKDSLTFAMRLRAALAARPRVQTDTLKQRLGDLLIRTWIDRAGGAHTTITNLKKNTVVVQRVVPAPRMKAVPRSDVARPSRLWNYVDAHLGAIMAVLAIVLFWILLVLYMRRRRACYPYAPYSNKR